MPPPCEIVPCDVDPCDDVDCDPDTSCLKDPSRCTDRDLLLQHAGQACTDDPQDCVPDAEPRIPALNAEPSGASCDGHWGYPEDDAASDGPEPGLAPATEPVRDATQSQRDTAKQTRQRLQQETYPYAAPAYDALRDLGLQDDVSPGTITLALQLATLAWDIYQNLPDGPEPPNKHWWVSCDVTIHAEARCINSYLGESRDCAFQRKADDTTASRLGGGPAEETQWVDVGDPCSYDPVLGLGDDACRVSFTKTIRLEGDDIDGVDGDGFLKTDGLPLDDARVCVEPMEGARVINRFKHDEYEAGHAAWQALPNNAPPPKSFAQHIEKECTDPPFEVQWPRLVWYTEEGCRGSSETIRHWWDPNTGEQGRENDFPCPRVHVSRLLVSHPLG